MDQNSRKNIFQELKLPDQSITIGHVGKFSESKNQIFILKTLANLVKEDERYIAILVGDGPLKQEMEKEAEKLGVSKHVRFLGVREDIPSLMNAFDVFLFPSLFEGFGIVTIEAQSSGTPCILSDTIPKSTDMGLGLTSFINLNENIEVWCQEIKKAIQKERPEKATIIEQISKKGYAIQHNVGDWLNLYGVNAV